MVEFVSAAPCAKLSGTTYSGVVVSELCSVSISITTQMSISLKMKPRKLFYILR